MDKLDIGLYTRSRGNYLGNIHEEKNCLCIILIFLYFILFELLGQLDALNMDNDISSDGSYDSDNEEFSISDDVITYQYNLIPQSNPFLI